MRHLLRLVRFRLRATAWYIFVRPAEMLETALADMDKELFRQRQESNGEEIQEAGLADETPRGQVPAGRSEVR